MRTGSMSAYAVSVLAAVLMLAACQGDVDGDGATASTSAESSAAEEDGFFSMEVSAAEICPETGGIASLPAGGNFAPELKTDEDVLVSGAEGVETRLTCSYGIGVVLPTEVDPDDASSEYVSIEEDQIVMDAVVTVGSAAFQGNPNLDLDSPSLSSLSGWGVTQVEDEEHETSGTCTDEAFLPISRGTVSCPAGEALVYSFNLRLTVVQRNLEISFHGEFRSPGSPIEDDDRELLRTAMREFATSAAERLPLAEVE